MLDVFADAQTMAPFQGVRLADFFHRQGVAAETGRLQNSMQFSHRERTAHSGAVEIRRILQLGRERLFKANVRENEAAAGF